VSVRDLAGATGSVRCSAVRQDQPEHRTPLLSRRDLMLSIAVAGSYFEAFPVCAQGDEPLALGWLWIAALVLCQQGTRAYGAVNG
jgi:hypothetical protein